MFYDWFSEKSKSKQAAFFKYFLANLLYYTQLSVDMLSYDNQSALLQMDHVQIFLSHIVVLESICYRMGAKRQINASNTTRGLQKNLTGGWEAC